MTKAIFEYLEGDKDTLHSCFLVNREVSVRFLWIMEIMEEHLGFLDKISQGQIIIWLLLSNFVYQFRINRIRTTMNRYEFLVL